MNENFCGWSDLHPSDKLSDCTHSCMFSFILLSNLFALHSKLQLFCSSSAVVMTCTEADQVCQVLCFAEIFQPCFCLILALCPNRSFTSCSFWAVKQSIANNFYSQLSSEVNMRVNTSEQEGQQHFFLWELLLEAFFALIVLMSWLDSSKDKQPSTKAFFVCFVPSAATLFDAPVEQVFCLAG